MSSKHNKTDFNFRTCIYLPPRVNSQEPWCVTDNGDRILVNSLPVLQMQMCLIFFGTLLFKSILCRIGISKFTSMSIVSLPSKRNFDYPSFLYLFVNFIL